MQTEADQRSEMIVSMERTLNPGWFYRRSQTSRYATISIGQYWDWLTYIDVRKLPLLKEPLLPNCLVY